MSELKNNNSGFSLVELLIAMVTGIMVLAGIYASFNSQQKLHTREQLIVDAEQNVRGAMHYMVREIRLAGMDVNKMSGAGFVVAGPHSIEFTINHNDDEDVSDADESITYGFPAAADSDLNGIADDGSAPIARVASFSGNIAEDIHALGFAYAFDNDGDGNLDFVDVNGDGLPDAGEEIWAYDSDADGDLDWNNDTGVALPSDVELDRIRAVRIWILARTRYPIKGYSGVKNFVVGDKLINRDDNFQYRLLTSTAKCRNLGIQN